MLSRSALGRNAPRALRKQCAANTRRGLATPSTPNFSYDVSETAGVKLANREVGGATTTLALVAKAGSRYQPFPGFSTALEQFAFKSTLKRSALRITRETELLGGEVSSSHSRENLVLKAKFLSGDLPYFAELLAEVASQTKYPTYELNELVINLVKYKQKTLLENPEALAIDTVHALAFHRGLGENITPTTAAPYEQYLTAEAVAEFAKGAYAKPNVAVVASGPNSTELSKWVNEFFGQLPSSVPSNQFQPRSTTPSKYFGGEQRVPGKNGNAVVIAFPGSSAYGTAGYKAEAAVLTALLGGESTIKWAPGFSLLGKATAGFSQAKVSTKNFSYSDAGLLTISVTGKADQVASASKNVVDTIKKVAAGEVASEDIKKAAALAKFRAFEAGQNLETGLEITGSGLIHGNKAYQLGEVAEAIDKVTEQQVKDLAKEYLSNNASVAAVGDLFQIPYAEDLGLTV
ncbi:hypothetical protein DTO166G4_5892 [Paecilomyces variotii]|nr:hypothetical protein DTO032I3_7584 [Paecilomyces variotii]KAJ9212531.1 hypothetical protein DTO166G4_5892 [Paecilomyces variotii]KAJ9237054.1 hypothetical protein DTO166G5_3739 [Paecilomyces variotii]KAJ9274226.1 hypothetical protein DTO021D3_8938 [Paecilomyces variotii]KAJ9316359.1 hypothetical protein DTO271D3_3372 [Paecilomyces variotii]